MKYIVERTFKDKDFTQIPLELSEYESCHFINCQLTQADISGARFINTVFNDCDLSNAKIHNTAFQDAVFKNCKMLGLRFDTCNDFNFSAVFEQCILSHSTFIEMKLSKSSFSHCQLIDIDFSDAYMRSSSMSHCDLMNAVFDQTNLEKTDLREAINYAINPNNNHIKGAKFSMPEAIRLLDHYQIEIE